MKVDPLIRSMWFRGRNDGAMTVHCISKVWFRMQHRLEAAERIEKMSPKGVLFGRHRISTDKWESLHVSPVC